MEAIPYLVPDYYPSFQCKMGQCRNACCQGWPVSIDRDKYFELLGADAPEALRRKLDCAMYLCDYPTPQRYAQLNHRFDGNCSLRDPDGRCGLQVCLGEEILPDVCRLYPRGIHGKGEHRECSCSNSCEAVPELFWDRTEPLRFVRLSLPLKPPTSYDCACTKDAGDPREKWEHRLFLLNGLQDRSLSLPQRLWLLCSSSPLRESPAEPSLLLSLQKAARLCTFLGERSDSLREAGASLLALWDSNNDPLALYRKGKEAWEELCPQGPLFLEHLLVNYAFFSRFPLEESPKSPGDPRRALCLIYALLRFLLLLQCAKAPAKESCIDLCAALFRLVAHTDFSRLVPLLLHRTNLCDEDIGDFLCI